MLDAVRKSINKLSKDFKFLHISTDEFLVRLVKTDYFQKLLPMILNLLILHLRLHQIISVELGIIHIIFQLL